MDNNESYYPLFISAIIVSAFLWLFGFKMHNSPCFFIIIVVIMINHSLS